MRLIVTQDEFKPKVKMARTKVLLKSAQLGRKRQALVKEEAETKSLKRKKVKDSKVAIAAATGLSKKEEKRRLKEEKRKLKAAASPAAKKPQ